MEHYLVCTVRTEDGQPQAQLDGFVQNCDLRTAQRYFAGKKKKDSALHSGREDNTLRLFKLVEVQ